jgi:hypothetical protein
MGASSPLAKGDPVLGISGLDPHILEFSTPQIAPTVISLGLKKKSWKKKKVIKTTPQKKVRAPPFVLAPWRQKKKSGLSRRKFPRLFWIVPSCALPTRYPTKHHSISGPARPLSPHVFFGGYF